MSDKPRWEIIHGDSLTVLESFPPSTFDAVITDPPYASGGRTQAEKSKATAKKYSSMGGNAPPDFDGDAKDQRSWTRWAAEWLYLARRAAKPGAPVCMFIDWRQLPCASDALQWAGWIWRGIAVWDKGNSRPQKGRFRQQAEYIVWGSNGDMPVSRPVPCLPGVFKYGNPQNRIHLTEKPLQLMQDLVKITEPGGHILDPFAGSGTTVLAAVKEGYVSWCALEYSVVGRISCYVPYDSARTNVCQWLFAEIFSLTAAVSNRIDSIRNLYIFFALNFPTLENPILEKMNYRIQPSSHSSHASSSSSNQSGLSS